MPAFEVKSWAKYFEYVTQEQEKARRKANRGRR